MWKPEGNLLKIHQLKKMPPLIFSYFPELHRQQLNVSYGIFISYLKFTAHLLHLWCGLYIKDPRFMSDHKDIKWNIIELK